MPAGAEPAKIRQAAFSWYSDGRYHEKIRETDGFILVSGDGCHMNFKKVDSSTIKCYVTNEEMEAYGITVDELMSDKSKARKFINYLLGLAKEEIGEVEINSMMTIQVQMIRDKGLLLTITSNFWSELPRDLKKSLIESMEDHLHQVMQEVEEGDLSKQEQEEMFEKILARMKETSQEPGRKASEDEEQEADSLTEEFGNTRQAVFSFDSLEHVLKLCSLAPDEEELEGSLLKDRDTYYLYVEGEEECQGVFHRFCTAALEYGLLYCAEENKIRLLRSRAECLIKENAVKILREIAGN